MSGDYSDEVYKAIESLTKADRMHLTKIAQFMIRGLGPNAEHTCDDLLSEAIFRTLEGTSGNGHGRHWNKNVDFIRHLKEAMRSICSHWRRDGRRMNITSEADFSSDEAHRDFDSPLEKAISGATTAEDRLFLTEIWEALCNRFPQDRAAQDVFVALCEGRGPSEIMRMLSLNSTQYSKVMKRLRMLIEGLL
jgi:hypothetical protein